MPNSNIPDIRSILYNITIIIIVIGQIKNNHNILISEIYVHNIQTRKKCASKFMNYFNETFLTKIFRLIMRPFPERNYYKNTYKGTIWIVVSCVFYL